MPTNPLSLTPLALALISIFIEGLDGADTGAVIGAGGGGAAISEAPSEALTAVPVGSSAGRLSPEAFMMGPDPKSPKRQLMSMLRSRTEIVR